MRDSALAFPPTYLLDKGPFRMQHMKGEGRKRVNKIAARARRIFIFFSRAQALEIVQGVLVELPLMRHRSPRRALPAAVHRHLLNVRARRASERAPPGQLKQERIRLSASPLLRPTFKATKKAAGPRGRTARGGRVGAVASRECGGEVVCQQRKGRNFEIRAI